MIQLDAVDEAPILKVSSRDSLASVQVVLEAIAQRHGVDWRRWPEWKCSDGWSKPLTWLALQYGSPAYERMVEFAFQRAWMLEHDPQAIPQVFDSFVNSMHALGQKASFGDEVEEQHASEQALRGMAAMFIATGPAGARLAYVAMRQALAHKRLDWLEYGWGKAMTAFERAELDCPTTKPGEPGAQETL
jgi:hypothetical protein